jgi:hypothetical protein
MLINIENFKSVLKKATLNNSIDSVQLNFKDGKIESKMINESNDAIVFLNVTNDVLSTNDETTFNFREPNANLIPFLNIIDEESANIEIERAKLVIKSGSQKSNIHFAAPTAVRVFGSEPREMDFFLTLPLDENFLNAYKKIKKIGNKFGKIYFSVLDNMFYMETTDKTNQFSNGLRFKLVDHEKEDISMFFDFKNFVNMMEVINGSAENFSMNFTWIPEQEKGAIKASKNDNSEIYFLMSREE